MNFLLHYCLYVELMLTVIKVFIILSLHVRIGNILANISVSSAFNWVSRYFLFLAKLKNRGRPFLEGPRRGTTLWDYTQEHLIVTRNEKVSLFVKLVILLPLLCFLWDVLTNKHCRIWSSMIILWIHSRIYQK